ncbi:MAG: ABC transporter ATP-binding protein [Armatimonadota bacterium]|nr:ABC transporter ATP-binding protein [Armatimonadota bacterium]MDR5696405.1 ABC transporter ATP-binding protein [Armatimonadota bacterium]
MSVLLELREVSAWYGAVRALQDVSLRVHEGEVVCLLGANGAGKTTVVRCVVGVLRPRSGQVWLGGRRVDSSPPAQVVAWGLGVVPEGRRLFPKMTVEENLRMGALHVRSEERVRQGLSEVYELFPVLRERRQQLAGTLSGGEQSMVAIGRGIVSSPRLLLLDEPSLGLSPRLTRELLGAVHRVAHKGTTVLLVEQNATQALAVASRGYVLEKGRVVAEGTASELATSQSLQTAYLRLS